MSLFKQLIRSFSSKPTTTTAFIEYTINEIKLLGRIGTEPKFADTRIIDANRIQQVVVFSLGTNRYLGEDEKGNVMTCKELHRICIFDENLRKLITSENISKGDRVYLSGRVQYNRISNKIITTIIANNLILLSKNEFEQVKEEEKDEIEVAQ